MIVRPRLAFSRGVTLIEMMIGLGILGFLMMLALPSFQTAIQNSQVRTAAEAVISGLQMARAEAVRRNRQVQLQFPNASNGISQAGGTDWRILADAQTGSMPAFDIAVQSRNATEGSSEVRIGMQTANNFATPAAAGANMPANITFTGLGRLTAATTVRQIDVGFAETSGARRLAIVISPGGQFRLCDPALSLAANPQGCA